MTDFQLVIGNHGVAWVRPNTTLNLIYIATEVDACECEIELTPKQARELGRLLIEAYYELEKMK
jgi:hypothetical protein